MRVLPLDRDNVPVAARFYCVCFGEPPWYEVCLQADVEQEIEETLSWPDTRSVAAFIDDRLVGVSYGYAVRRKPDVMALVNVPPETFYISEIFVDPAFRGRSTARYLVDALLKTLRPGSLATVRTSVHQLIIRRLFAERGWQEVAEQTVESEKWIDGQCVVSPDRRVLMVGRQ